MFVRTTKIDRKLVNLIGGKLSGAGFLALLLIAGPYCKANVITLNFEGIDTYPDASAILIQNYYNGGAASNGAVGPNYGVTFTAGAALLCMNTSAADCSNTSKEGLGVAGSQYYGMFFPTTNPIMDVAGGFTTGFSMAYSNPASATIGVQLWSGLDGTGTLLASSSLGATTDGASLPACYTADYCPFANFSLSFSGTAESVVFTGTANQSAYDDFTFGSTQVGGGAPEPASVLLMFGALVIGGWFVRRSRVISIVRP